MNTNNPNKNKKIATILLILWIICLPLALIVQVFIRFVTAQVPEVENIDAVVNILSFLIGLYFFFGWIPVLIFYSKSKRTVKK